MTRTRLDELFREANQAVNSAKWERFVEHDGTTGESGGGGYSEVPSHRSHKDFRKCAAHMMRHV